MATQHKKSFEIFLMVLIPW